ncbi:MAG: hypothetical protein AAF738_02745 [Bacteroidota bacterium]
MKKTLLLEILKKISPKERTRFQQYVHSPFFNKNKKVQQLCNYLLQYSPDFEHPKLGKVNVYAAIFGKDEEYQELRLNNIISDLLHLLYSYLSQIRYESQAQERQIELLTLLQERNLVRPIPRLLRKVEQLRKQQTERSIDFYRMEAEYFQQLNYYALSQGEGAQDENLQHASNALDVYYWLSKLRNACEMANRQVMINANYQSDFLAHFLAQEDLSTKYADVPALLVYYQTYLLLQKGEESNYEQVRTLLERHLSVLPKSELRTLYRYLLNYTVRQINYGKTNYYGELLRSYRVLMAQGILLQQGYLTKWTFINITTAGIRSGEFDWTAYFIETHQDYLRITERQNTVDYQWAALYFAKKDYSKVLDFLQQVEFTDAFYHVSAKIILIKVYYELKEEEALYALIKATQELLRRTRTLSAYHRTSYANFAKLTKKLQRIRYRPTPKQLAQYEDVCMNTAPLANKGWLMEKYEALSQ